MQIKTMRHNLTLVSMPIIKKTSDTNAGGDMEKRKLLRTVGGVVNWYSHYEKQYGGSSKS